MEYELSTERWVSGQSMGLSDVEIRGVLPSALDHARVIQALSCNPIS